MSLSVGDVGERAWNKIHAENKVQFCWNETLKLLNIYLYNEE
jgi:hypothetical protein